MVPGLRRIVPAFPRRTHPLTVESFMMRPHEELDGLSAVSWLGGGGAIDTVVELVDELSWGWSPAPKVPRRPPERLVTRAENITQWSGALWRIHRTGGAHPSAWNAPRTFGPLRSMRWDPHPEPVGPHPTGPGVSYCAATSDTAFAEVFQ